MNNIPRREFIIKGSTALAAIALLNASRAYAYRVVRAKAFCLGSTSPQRALTPLEYRVSSSGKISMLGSPRMTSSSPSPISIGPLSTRVRGGSRSTAS